MNLLKLVAKIILDGSGFKAGMKEVQKIGKDTTSEIARDFKSALAGYFGYQAIKATVFKIAEDAVKIKHLGEQLNMTTDEVQKYGKAAREMGLDEESAMGMVNRMGAARKEAAESNEELRKTFARYGVTLKDLQNPENRNIDLLTRMGKAMQGIHVTEKQREEFREIFGRNAPKALEAIIKAQEGGPIELISAEQINRIERAHRQIVELRRQWEVRGAPAVGGGAETLATMLKIFPSQLSLAAGLIRAFRAGPNADNPSARATGEMFGPSLPGKSEEELYKNKVAIGEKNAADKAELDLTRSVLEMEVKRKGVTEQMRQLKKEIADAEGDAATFAESAKKNDVDRAFVAERMADAEKARGQLLDIQNHGLRGAADSETARGNVIGSLARLRYFETLGGAGGVGGDPIPKQQLSVAQAQRVLLQRIAEARVASAVFSQ